VSRGLADLEGAAARGEGGKRALRAKRHVDVRKGRAVKAGVNDRGCERWRVRKPSAEATSSEGGGVPVGAVIVIVRRGEALEAHVEQLLERTQHAAAEGLPGEDGGDRDGEHTEETRDGEVQSMAGTCLTMSTEQGW
jgi:hypothetical protein